MKTTTLLAILVVALSSPTPAADVGSPSIPGTRMVVDWPKLINRQDISLEVLPNHPRDGLLMGNGDIGTSLYGPPELLTIHVGKNDLWDYRDPMDSQFRGHTHKEFLAKYADPDRPAIMGYRSESDSSDDLDNVQVARTWHIQMPTSKPGGKIRFRNKHRVDSRDRARLDLWNSEVTLSSPWRGAPSFRTFVARSRNVIVAQYFPSGRESFEIELARHKDTTGLIPTAPEFGSSGRDIWFRYRFPGDANTYPEGFEYVLYGRVLGAEEVHSTTEPEAAKIRQERRGRFFEAIEGRSVAHVQSSMPVTLLVAVATTRDALDPFEHAKSDVSATEKDLSTLTQAHRKWWQSYWQRSFVVLPGRDFLTQQWYMSQYLLACSWRAGKVAPGLFGCWAWQDFPHFGNDYHWDYNMQQAVWGAYSSNHLEETIAYNEAALSLLPTAQREARERYGMEGAKFFLISYPRNYTYNPFPYVHTDQMMSLNGFVAQPLWWYYQYSQDREFLRTRAYPLMRDCATFYEHYVTRAADGKYDIWPTAVWDIMLSPHLVHNKNCLLDLAYIRYLMKTCVAASELLDVDADRRPGWTRIAQNLRDYPTVETPNGKVFSAFEGVNPGFHFPVTAGAIFPGEDIGLHTPKPLREIATRTVQSMGYIDDGEWVLKAMAQVRLGLNRWDWYEKSTRNTRLPNGGLVIKNAAYSLWVHAFGWPIVINESLLQSYTGQLRVAPVTLETPARFANLRTVGAFLVAGEIAAGGRVAYLAITSEAGKTCTLVRPWTEAVRVREADTLQEVTLVESGQALTFPTAAGKTYVVDRPNEAWENLPLREIGSP